MNDRRDHYRLDIQLLSDLWVFRSVARFGSVTAAAKRLGVTQGAVSQRIQRLEGRLGTSLFLRQHGRLSITNAGTGLLATMNDVAIAMTGALATFDRVQQLSLVVSCVPSLATDWLVPKLDEFYEKHPDIALLLRAELSAPSAERMEDEGIDVIIAYQQKGNSDLHELAAVQEKIIPVCSPTYRAQMDAGKQPPPITRLHDDAPWMNSPHEFEWNLWESAYPSSLTNIVAERNFNLGHLTARAALCDQGVAIGRTIIVNRLLKLGELIAAEDLPPIWGPSYRIFAYRPGNANSPVRTFINWLVEAMTESQKDSLALLNRAPLANRANSN